MVANLNRILIQELGQGSPHMELPFQLSFIEASHSVSRIKTVIMSWKLPQIKTLGANTKTDMMLMFASEIPTQKIPLRKKRKKERNSPCFLYLA